MVTTPSRKVRSKSRAGRCLLPALSVLLLVPLAWACSPGPSATPAPMVSPSPPRPTMAPQHGWELPAGQVLFIDRRVHLEGACIEGDCQPGPMIDFPTYRFDPETGILNSWLPVDLGDDLQMLYGNGTSLAGLAGGGAASGLTEIYAIPAKVEGVRIVQVDGDGTAYLESGGELLVLAPGQAWTNTTEDVEEQEDGKVRLTSTEQIVNHGILDTDKIVFPAP